MNSDQLLLTHLRQDALETLTKLNLSPKEASVYVTLLELQESLASAVARRTGIKRPTVYKILEDLQRRSLVSTLKKNNALFFRAISPQAFFDIQENHLRTQAQTVASLKNTLITFANLHGDPNVIPQMSVYHGTDGLIQILDDTLTAKDEIWCWSNAHMAIREQLKENHPRYLRKKIVLGLHSKCIFTNDSAGKKFQKNSKKELREVVLVPPEQFIFGFDNEINLYNDKMSIISLKDNIGIIVQNQSIANSQKSIFWMMFQMFKAQQNPPIST